MCGGPDEIISTAEGEEAAAILPRRRTGNHESEKLEGTDRGFHGCHPKGWDLRYDLLVRSTYFEMCKCLGDGDL